MRGLAAPTLSKPELNGEPHMSIRLNQRPSIDGLGVKRWTYPLRPDRTLFVFWRPKAYRKGEAPYLIRVDHIDGRTLASELATTKVDAIRRAKEYA